MRVEGSSSPARICCHSSGRLVGSPAAAGAGSGVGSGVGGVGAAAATAAATTGAAGAGTGAGTGAAGAGMGAGAAAGVAAVAAGASLSSPSSSTSSHRRGCTLWRNCCSLPLSWACHCSSRALPMRRARVGSSGRTWGDTLVSSSRSGATPASTRSRSMPARPCSTAPGSRPRSSRVRIASITPSGSLAARALASWSSSCSGTAPSRSHTAMGSTGGGNRLS